MRKVMKTGINFQVELQLLLFFSFFFGCRGLLRIFFYVRKADSYIQKRKKSLFYSYFFAVNLPFSLFERLTFGLFFITITSFLQTCSSIMFYQNYNLFRNTFVVICVCVCVLPLVKILNFCKLLIPVRLRLGFVV